MIYLFKATDTNDEYWEVIKTKKNHFKLLHNGFVYTKHKSFSNQTRWRCAKRGRCRGSLMTTNDFKELYPKLEHSHPPDEEYCQNMRTRFMSPPGSKIVFHDGNLLFKSKNEENTTGSNQGIKLLQNEAGELIMVNETPTHFMNLLRKYPDKMSDRQLSSNEIEKVLELQNSTLLRRLPGFGYPDFGLGHLGLSEESDVTIFSSQKNVEGMLEQQKMIQSLLKQYQKNMEPQWMTPKGLDLKCKKRFSTGDIEIEKKRDSERPVKENIPVGESKKMRKKEDEGKPYSKQRKTNFTSKEVETLLDCVRKKKEVILFGVAGGRGWAKAWQDIAKVVTKVEGIPRSEGDVRKKWTYLKWEAKNTSKPGRDPVSKQVLNILTSRDREVQEAMNMRNMDFPAEVPPPPVPQPQQQAAQQTASPQVSPQPQPSSPNVPNPKKQGLPPLAPKPPGAKSQQTPPPTKQLPKLLPKPQGPPEVCLRWNSYHSNMQNTFPSLLTNEQFVDVTLACDSRSIKCHKVMLSACSPYMEELLSANPCQHPIVFLKDMKFWQLQALIDFMYRGEVNVTQDKLPSLLAAAEALQIKGLSGLANPMGSPIPTKYPLGGVSQSDVTTEEVDQASFFRQMHFPAEVKHEFDDEYLQDTDDSPPPTPKSKRRKTSHAVTTQTPSLGIHGGSGTPSTSGSSGKSPSNKAKRDKERVLEPLISHTMTTSAHSSGNKSNASAASTTAADTDQKRKSDSEKTDPDPDGDGKDYGEDSVGGYEGSGELLIDEDHAQIILERYSSQNDDYPRNEGDGDESCMSG